jgi:dTDP-4-amino-4,6-dideoxygalactose transaminase
MKEINSAFSDQIENIQQQLRKQGIPSVSYYTVPLHLQPVFAFPGSYEGGFPRFRGCCRPMLEPAHESLPF